MEYYKRVGSFGGRLVPTTFQEAQRLIGPLRHGSANCSRGCCRGSYDNLGQFVATAKEHGHKRIIVDPSGPSVYAE